MIKTEEKTQKGSLEIIFRQKQSPFAVGLKMFLGWNEHSNTEKSKPSTQEVGVRVPEGSSGLSAIGRLEWEVEV